MNTQRTVMAWRATERLMDSLIYVFGGAALALRDWRYAGLSAVCCLLCIGLPIWRPRAVRDYLEKSVPPR